MRFNYVFQVSRMGLGAAGGSKIAISNWRSMAYAILPYKPWWSLIRCRQADVVHAYNCAHLQCHYLLTYLLKLSAISKQFWNCFETVLFQPKQPWNVFSCFIQSQPVLAFMQNCSCLWRCQSYFSLQTWRSYGLLVSVNSSWRSYFRQDVTHYTRNCSKK